MSNDAEKIMDRHKEEERRSAMAKRMAEEEMRRNDVNVQQWDGMQSNKAYMFSFGTGRGSGKTLLSKVFMAVGAIVSVAVILILIYTAIKSFSM